MPGTPGPRWSNRGAPPDRAGATETGGSDMRMIRALLTVAFLAGAALLSATGPASAAPAGYFGPQATCPGEVYQTIEIPGPAYILVWYSPADSGSFCAKTFDNEAGSHYMSVSIRREDWQTVWSDSGTFTTYAGGVGVKGVDIPHCAYVSGKVTSGGVTRTGGDRVC
jgi:hypothetical protein